MFLVGAFPKRARLLQWLFFFRQTTELTLHVPFFSTDFNRFRGNPAGSSPCFSQKLIRSIGEPDWRVPLSIVSALRLFSKILNVSKGSPWIFLYFTTEWIFKIAQKFHPFTIFGTMRLFKILIFLRIILCSFRIILCYFMSPKDFPLVFSVDQHRFCFQLGKKLFPSLIEHK